MKGSIVRACSASYPYRRLINSYLFLYDSVPRSLHVSLSSNVFSSPHTQNWCPLASLSSQGMAYIGTLRYCLLFVTFLCVSLHKHWSFLALPFAFGGRVLLIGCCLQIAKRLVRPTTFPPWRSRRSSKIDKRLPSHEWRILSTSWPYTRDTRMGPRTSHRITPRCFAMVTQCHPVRQMSGKKLRKMQTMYGTCMAVVVRTVGIQWFQSSFNSAKIICYSLNFYQLPTISIIVNFLPKTVFYHEATYGGNLRKTGVLV